MPRLETNEVIMTTATYMKALAAFSFFALTFFALAAAAAFASEDHAGAAAMSGVHTTMTTASAPMDVTQAAPQALMPSRSAENAKATQQSANSKSAAPELMFEKPFRKWWTDDQE
jgi:hypothetical protein